MYIVISNGSLKNNNNSVKSLQIEIMEVVAIATVTVTWSLPLPARQHTHILAYYRLSPHTYHIQYYIVHTATILQ